MAVSLSHRRRNAQSLRALSAAAAFLLWIDPEPGRATIPPPVVAASVADVGPAPNACFSADLSVGSFRDTRTEWPR